MITDDAVLPLISTVVGPVNITGYIFQVATLAGMESRLTPD